MRYLMLCLALVTLAGCGADGAPERPDPKQEASGPGIRVSGSGGFGVAVSNGGSGSSVRRPAY
ncbi:MAG: argininosuccinate lyase [Sedimentitalea sp.]|nr:argininosuccinate lyase [Sedimentitalea sp.]